MGATAGGSFWPGTPAGSQPEGYEPGLELAAITACAPDAVYTSYGDRIASWNGGAEALYGYTAAEVLGRSMDMLHPAGRDTELAELYRRLACGETVAGHRTVRRHKDGSLVPVWLSQSPIRNRDGVVCGAAAVVRDLTHMDRLVNGLRVSEARYRSIVENAQEGIALLGPDGTCTFANRRIGQLLGRPVAELLGVNAYSLIDLESATAVFSRSEERQSGKAGQYEVNYLRPDGDVSRLLVSAAPQFESDGSYAGSLCMVSDLSGLRRAEEELAHQALHDPLTGLPNRALLSDRIDQALTRSSGDSPSVAILFCDLDGFKDVNDTFGHHVGDELLRIVGERLVDAVRPGDTVARIGGDEFIVLGEGISDQATALGLAARLRVGVAQPIRAAGTEIVITCSVGVALAPAEGAAALLRNADSAMYRAKQSGRNRAEFFDQRLRDQAGERVGLLADLRSAVARGQLRLHYQPVMALDSQRISGVEALVRWQHPDRGLVVPDKFIRVAEDHGLIVEIGKWVLREACRQAALWAKAGPVGRPLHMAVNISARQLTPGAGLVESVAEILAGSGVDPTTLVLEITESVLMSDAEAALRILTQLKALGVRLAVDDFGTGYSSLVYLKRFPVDLLKIDRTFVAGLGQNPDDDAIVASVIGLAHAVGIDAVAEGVETSAQLHALHTLGCAYGQGYLWSRPVPAAELEQAISGNAPRGVPTSG